MDLKKRIKFEVSEIRECLINIPDGDFNQNLAKRMIEERLKNIERTVEKTVISIKGGE